MSTRAYVDGFNLYHGSLEGTTYKWLDLPRMCATVSGRSIDVVKYFTARVRDNPPVAQRQDTYLRAVAAHGNTEIHEGTFLAHNVRRPLVDTKGGKREWVLVRNYEEKGSDVNLAAHLIVDCLVDGVCDSAVVVTNDSDLVAPVRMVSERGVQVLVINPHKRPAKAIKRLGVEVRPIFTRTLRQCQMPDPVPTDQGPIHMPPKWKVT